MAKEEIVAFHDATFHSLAVTRAGAVELRLTDVAIVAGDESRVVRGVLLVCPKVSRISVEGTWGSTDDYVLDETAEGADLVGGHLRLGQEVRDLRLDLMLFSGAHLIIEAERATPVEWEV